MKAQRNRDNGKTDNAKIEMIIKIKIDETKKQ